MDDDIRLLAIVSCDAGHSDTDIIRSNNNEMIETIFGIFLAIAGGGDQTNPDPASMIYKGIMTGQKIIEKEKNKESEEQKPCGRESVLYRFDRHDIGVVEKLTTRSIEI